MNSAAPTRVISALRRVLRAESRAAPSGAGGRHDRPVALIYRGPASLPGCPDAVAVMLAASRWGFDVRCVGPAERLPLSGETLAQAILYVQPGGATLKRTFRKMRGHRSEIRQFVASGGRYLGFFLGAYLAGATPGFAQLPGDTDQYITSRDSTVDSDRDTLVQVMWRGQRRTLFFQDGPRFWLQPAADATIVATYPNHAIAALVTGFGAGRVGVVGPHPEATDDWFIDAGLAIPLLPGHHLGLDLLEAVMGP